MKKAAFTLVELLVVLIIIGVLVALILPNTLKAIDSANVKETASTLRTIDTAIQLCYSEKRSWGSCDTVSELLTDKYLETDPKNDPWGKTYAITNGSDGISKISDKSVHFGDWPNLSSIIR